MPNKLGPCYLWVIVPNSGDTLKLQVPSYTRKGVSGPTNHWCRVTSLENSERNVGNRGSKSAIRENIAVKEQRVDGIRHFINKTFKVYSKELRE